MRLNCPHVAKEGLVANVPEDAIYPLNLGDEADRLLDGTNKYVLHFEKASLPPVEAFWSVTLYDPELPSRQQPQSVRSQQLDAIQLWR